MERHRRAPLSSLPSSTPTQPPAGPGRRVSGMNVPRLRAFGLTDAGRQRERNEDSFFCDPVRGIFMVIDGVGGAAAGDVAAELARDLVSMRLRYRSGSIEERLHKAITTANKAIYVQGQTHPEQRGMACVLTAAVVEGGVVTVGHVGDTRLYEIRRDGLRKVTRDHSVVGMQEDTGTLSEWEAMLHPRRNEILRDVGSEWHELGDADFIDVYRCPFVSASALLLCTDGLTDLVPSEVIFETVRTHAGDPEAGARALVHLANQSGGTDNVTVVLVEGEGFAAAEAAEAPAPMPERRSGRRSGRVAFWVGLVLALAGLAWWMLP